MFYGFRGTVFSLAISVPSVRCVSGSWWTVGGVVVGGGGSSRQVQIQTRYFVQTWTRKEPAPPRPRSVFPWQLLTPHKRTSSFWRGLGGGGGQDYLFLTFLETLRDEFVLLEQRA